MAPGSKTAGLAQVHRDLGQPTLTVTIRPGVRIISTRGFSRDVESVPDPAEVQRVSDAPRASSLDSTLTFDRRGDPKFSDFGDTAECLLRGETHVGG
ncbi:hypothetical protein FOMG_00218 [Fusarium oxysporum f. sp. melonis 26406]|uniref:Uncharacterized protein n=1 Tax=Fusarium oxysporum f. sp. melonis 26406 TaxID=1089452 RepID=X0BNJ0_FUSOX|nr:hypothetical protein FOMG_00218 [Fusarium oxysporum f. sp. melonis 26406]